MNDARFQQTAHGFTKLTAVRSEAGAWRRCVAGEAPHAIVARVMGLDTFSIVTNGELDGLDALTAGATYGVGTNGDLQVGLSPTVARVVRSTAILVDLSTATASGSSDLSAINAAIAALQTAIAQTVIVAGGPTGSSNTVPVITYDAKGRLTEVTTATITASSIGAVSSAQARQYAWSVAS